MAPLEIASPENPWVSRGALKLAFGLDHFGFDVRGAVALDLGASTGGFTQVMLARGASCVYAVDVGRGQMHPSLRDEARVVNIESTNARELDARLIPEPVDVIVADVSFISLKLVLPAAFAFAKPSAKLLVLVKPQFEVGPRGVVKGFVRNPALREAAVGSVADFIGRSEEWRVLGAAPSPITGGDGNEEFLLAAQRG